LDLALQHTAVLDRLGLVDLLFKVSVDRLATIKELVDLDLAVNQDPLVVHLHHSAVNQDHLAVHLDPLEVSLDMEVHKEELRGTAVLVDMEKTLLV
jgi:hypothetical protein